MKPFSEDTHPEAHAVQVRLLRGMTSAQRLAIAMGLRETADTMALARLRRQYPMDDARSRALRLASLRIGPELMRLAFGWDPVRQGW